MEFQQRLGRSRSTYHKAQYLRIQAVHLAEVGTGPFLEGALSLLNQLIVQFPDASQLASAHLQRGDCLADLGRHTEAFDAYEAAFVAQRAYPNLHTGAALAYGELAVALRRADLYQRVEQLLREFDMTSGPQFPVTEYQYAVIRAFVAAERKDWATVRDQAAKALAAAAKTESPFRYHRTLGLVSSVDPAVVAQLREWCAA